MSRQHDRSGSAVTAGILFATALLLLVVHPGSATTDVATAAEVEQLARRLRTYDWTSNRIAAVVSFAN